MSSARLFVRAVLVTDGDASHLTAVFDALANQTVQPDDLHVVVANNGTAPAIPPHLRATVTVSEATTYSQAVADLLQSHPSHPREYLWLLHDDTAPLPDALAALAATARKRRRAAVIGAAHVRWHDRHRLVNLGTTVSKVGARRITLVEEDDVNQGQYNERDDVLAVSMAAALVRRDVWEECDGLDPAYGGFGDSIDFCRRCWRAGHDVVIVPAAKVRHAQETLYGRRGATLRGRRGTYARRRTSEWYHALAWNPLWALPFLVLWVFVSAPARAVGRIVQNESGMIGADLSVPWRVLARLPDLRASRQAIARTSTRPASDIRPLLAGLRTIVSHVRARELGAYEQWRAQSAPSDVVRAELAAARSRRRKATGIVALIATGMSLVLHGQWIPGLLGGRMLVGPGLGVTDVSTQELWQRAWSGWSEQGFGAPALDGAFAALMLPLSIAPGGLRLGVGFLLALGVLWASLSAWSAAGAATRSVWARGVVALAYGLWPLYLQSIDEGRVGAVLAHIVVPWVLLGIARAAGWHRGEVVGDGEVFPAKRPGSPSAAMAGAVALAVVTTAAPVLLAPLVLATLGAGMWAGRYRWRVWGMPIPSLVLAGPALMAWWESGPERIESAQVLARENGPIVGAEYLEPWAVAAGIPTYATLTDPVMVAIHAALGLLLVTAALLALFVGRSRRAAYLGWCLAALGVATAAVSQALVVVAADGSGSDAYRGWPGSGSSLVAAGLLIAGAAAVHTWKTRTSRPQGEKAKARPAAVAALVVSVAVIGVGLGAGTGLFTPRSPMVELSSVQTLPLVAQLEQQVETQQRVLVVWSDEDGAFRYAVHASDGDQVLSGRAHHADTGVPLTRLGEDGEPTVPVDTLAGAVATLVGSGSGASEQLAAWGIGVIVAPAGADDVVGALDQVAEVSLMGASELGTSWRVHRPGSEQPVSRAWIDSPGEELVIPMAGTRGTLDISRSVAGTVVVAASADPSWRATLNGVELRQVSDPYGRAAFTLPGAGGELTVEYSDPTHERWRLLAAVVLGWALLGSVPIHGQRHRKVAP